MAKYFFDAFDGVTLVADQVGDEFDTDQTAADQAVSLLPEFMRDHLPRKHNLTTATSVRNEDGDVIFRSIGIVRSQWSNRSENSFSVTINQTRSKLIRTKELAAEMMALREKLEVNVNKLFYRLAEAAGTADIRCNLMSNGKGSD